MSIDDIDVGQAPRVEANTIEWEQCTFDGRVVFSARASVSAAEIEGQAAAESTHSPSQAIRLAVGRAWLRWWEARMASIEAHEQP